MTKDKIVPDLDLVQLEMLANAATPDDVWGANGWEVMNNPDREIGSIPKWYISCEGVGAYPIAYVYRKEDADFFLAAKKSIDTLLALVKAAEGEVVRQRIARERAESSFNLRQIIKEREDAVVAAKAAGIAEGLAKAKEIVRTVPLPIGEELSYGHITEAWNLRAIQVTLDAAIRAEIGALSNG